MTSLRPLGAEDGSNGYWDARNMGNGYGQSFIVRKGVRTWVSDAQMREIVASGGQVPDNFQGAPEGTDRTKAPTAGLPTIKEAVGRGGGRAGGGSPPPPPPGFVLDATPPAAVDGTPQPPPGFVLDQPSRPEKPNPMATTPSITAPPNLSGLPAIGPILGAMGLNGAPRVEEALADPQAAYDSALAKLRQSQFPQMSDEQWAEYSRTAFKPYGLTELNQHGALFGLTDEMGAGLGALGSGVKNLLGDKNSPDFGEAYGDYEALERARRDLGRQQSGILGTGAEILGGVAAMGRPGMVKGAPMPGTIGPAPGLVPTIAAPSGNRVINAAKSLTGSAAAGGAYGFGATDGSLDARLGGAGAGALFAAGAGVAAPLVARTVGGAIAGAGNRAATRAAIRRAPTASAIRSQAQGTIRAAEAIGAVVAQPAMKGLVTRSQNLARAEGLLLPNGKLVEGFPKLTGAMKAIKAFAKGSLDMKQAQSVQRAIRRVAKSADIEEARLGRLMLGEFEDFMDGLPPSAFSAGNGKEAVRLWAKHRGEWARVRRTETIENILVEARYAKGGFAEGLRSGFRKVLKSRRRQRGFDPADLAAMEQFVEGGSVQALLDRIGSGAGLPGVGFGGLAGGVTGAVVVPAAGVAARGLSNRAARNVGQQIRASVATGGQLPRPPIPLPPPIINGVARRIGVSGENTTLEDMRAALGGRR